jgi:hypothetical protein
MNDGSPLSTTHGVTARREGAQGRWDVHKRTPVLCTTPARTVDDPSSPCGQLPGERGRSDPERGPRRPERKGAKQPHLAMRLATTPLHVVFSGLTDPSQSPTVDGSPRRRTTPGNAPGDGRQQGDPTDDRAATVTPLVTAGSDNRTAPTRQPTRPDLAPGTRRHEAKAPIRAARQSGVPRKRAGGVGTTWPRLAR